MFLPTWLPILFFLVPTHTLLHIMTFPSFDSNNRPISPVNLPRNASMTMPNVFVVPPEEDKTPPWCFFDAENPRSSQIQERQQIERPSITVDSDEAIFDRDTTQRVPGVDFETRTIVEALITDGEYDNDTASESSFEGHMEIEDEDTQCIPEGINPPGPSSTNQNREPGDDSDVIEVVKVSRRKSLAKDQGENQSLRAFSEYKKSMTLKSRASKVFRSLRGTLRSSKPRAEDIFSAPPPLPPPPTRRMSQVMRKSDNSEREHVPRPRTPTISRKNSNIITQLFKAPSLKSRSSISSFDEPIASIPAEANQIPSPPVSPQSSHFGSQPLSRRASLYTPSQEDETRLRAASPTPTTSTSKSRNRRFSIMNLHKIFSFSSSSAPPPNAISSDDESGRATPTLRSNYSTPSASSSISSPKTPTTNEMAPPVRLVTKEEPTDIPIVDELESLFDNNIGLNLGLGLTLDSGSTITAQQTTPRKERTSLTWSSITPTALKRSDTKKASSRSAEIDDPADTSLEMRLDSFHFDDLSFDANRF